MQLEDAVREWLKLYKDVNPRLLGNATKRETVFEVLEQSNLLPQIEKLYSMYRIIDFPSKTFVASLEALLATVELAIAKEIAKSKKH